MQLIASAGVLIGFGAGLGAGWKQYREDRGLNVFLTSAVIGAIFGGLAAFGLMMVLALIELLIGHQIL